MVLKLWETHTKSDCKGRIKSGVTDVILSPSWLDNGKKSNTHGENISWYFQHRSKDSYLMRTNCCTFPSALMVILEVWKKMKDKILFSDKLIPLTTLGYMGAAASTIRPNLFWRCFRENKSQDHSKKEWEKRPLMKHVLPGFQLGWIQGAPIYPRRSIW